MVLRGEAGQGAVRCFFSASRWTLTSFDWFTFVCVADSSREVSRANNHCLHRLLKKAMRDLEQDAIGLDGHDPDSQQNGPVQLPLTQSLPEATAAQHFSVRPGTGILNITLS